MATTPNYDLNLPAVGGDTGAWGGLLNDNFDTLDTVVKAVSDVADGAATDAAAAQSTADAALPKAGGTMTGNIAVKTADAATTAVTPAAGTATLDLSASDVFTVTIASATALAFSNVPATGRFAAVYLQVTNGGLGLTFPASVKWDTGTAPTLKTSGVDCLVFCTIDGGTIWRAKRFYTGTS